MVVVEAGQHDLVQLLGRYAEVVQRGSDRRAAPRRAGVDEGGSFGSAPQVGVAGAQRQEVQSRKQLTELHGRDARTQPS
ncbi:hypothetical protein [Blastococcus sp. SYSU DS1024]